MQPRQPAVCFEANGKTKNHHQQRIGLSLSDAAACKAKPRLQIALCCCQKAFPSNSDHVSIYLYSLACCVIQTNKKTLALLAVPKAKVLNSSTLSSHPCFGFPLHPCKLTTQRLTESRKMDNTPFCTFCSQHSSQEPDMLPLTIAAPWFVLPATQTGIPCNIKAEFPYCKSAGYAWRQSKGR